VVFEELAFDMAFIFKYSVRPGTTAEPLGDPIAPETKEARNKVLLDILGQSSLRRNQALIGSEEEVLVEGPARRGEGMYLGRNRGHRKIIFPGNDRLVGELVPVLVTDASVSYCSGELILAGVQ